MVKYTPNNRWVCRSSFSRLVASLGQSALTGKSHGIKVLHVEEMLGQCNASIPNVDLPPNVFFAKGSASAGQGAPR